MDIHWRAGCRDYRGRRGDRRRHDAPTDWEAEGVPIGFRWHLLQPWCVLMLLVQH